ncbi:meiosis-specific serine threonine- kinase mek1 protein [Rutstroemia sp. NJR-2017a BVV2]|nr:meiosis-specific serine threonine- kinase mek1 protein [Rutstroemia sp. NJR-2017a BVV2]
MNELTDLCRFFDDSEDLMMRRIFAAEADRFELWSVNLGLFVYGHGSLDYRVREAPSLKSTLQEFIADLNRALIEGEWCFPLSPIPAATNISSVLEYYQGDRSTTNKDNQGTIKTPIDEFQRSLLDDAEDGMMDSDMDLLLDSIKEPIDCLYKLSTRIRNPAIRLGSIKAQNHQQLDEDTRVDLFDVFKNLDYDHISSLFRQYRNPKNSNRADLDHDTKIPTTDRPEGNPHKIDDAVHASSSKDQARLSENSEALIRRFSRANVRRRQQFAYWKKHQSNLHKSTRRFTDATRLLRFSEEEATTDQARTGDRIIPVLKVAGFSAESVTTATNINPSRVDLTDDKSTTSISEYVPSAWEPNKDVLQFPDPPLHPSADKFFECPVCATICSTDVLRPKAWRAHLIHDLRPYVCTYEVCSIPDQQYDTRQDWIAHEDSCHRKVWRCPQHPAEIFPQLGLYRTHLQNQHLDYANDGVQKAMITTGESTLTVPDRCCPICLYAPENMGELQKHIALHLERMALFALPRSLYIVDDSKEGDSKELNRDISEFKHNVGGEDLKYDSNEEFEDGYLRTTAISDLNESIHRMQEAVEATPEDHPDRMYLLNNLGIGLYNRYLKTRAIANLDGLIDDPDRSIADLDESIRRMQEAVEATPEDHPERSSWLNNLGRGLYNRYSETGAIADLDGSIRRMQEAIEIIPEDHPDRSSWLNNLEIALRGRDPDLKTRAMDDQKPETVRGSPATENTELPSTEGQTLADETYRSAERATISERDFKHFGSGPPNSIDFGPLFDVGDNAWLRLPRLGNFEFSISAKKIENGNYKYQIMDPDGILYQKGEWVNQERLLRSA